MADEIYFQWQNDYLLHTIYPLREVKLRDFLLAYFEIDIWKQYKGKSPQDIPDEVTANVNAQVRKLSDAVENFNRLQTYLLDDDVTDQFQTSYPDLDADVMTKINVLHKTFKTYFPKYTNPLQQKYFVSARVREFEDMRKNVLFQISEKQRIVRNMGPTWAFTNTYQQAAQKMANVSIKIIEQELATLYSFLSAIGRISGYKQQLIQLRAQKQSDQASASTKLAALKASEATLASSLEAAARTLDRMQNPPDINSLKAYFLDDDVTDVYQPQFPDPDMDVLVAINNLHKTVKGLLPTYKNPTVERYFLGQRVKEIEDLRAARQQNLNDKQRAAQYMPPEWPLRAANDQAIQRLTSVTLKMIDLELDRLYDILWAYDMAAKPPAEINALIAQKQQEQAGLQNQLQANRNDQAAQNAIIQSAAALLSLPEKDALAALVVPEKITVEDIVRGKTEDYKAALMLKDKDELLEEIVKRFTQEPTRFPLWLQYMVIHFSGMRYQTAHGSWADPKDLLLSLRTKFVGDEIKRADEDAIESLCEQKYYLYKSILSPTDPTAAAAAAAANLDSADHPTPLLAKATESEWRSKIDYHLTRIDPASLWNKRRALLDFRVDEENYEVEKMTDQQVLDALDDLKDQLPDWMWKEIVQVTQLRLKEVTDADWEKLNPADQAARWTSQMAQYNQIMNDWKAKYLTGWRQEHEISEDIIVTSAVCNEVAEHIQHVRGNHPGAGLSARPEWYLSQERKGAQARGADRPYFVKPQTADHFKPGASLLFLRWVNKPADPWNITRPLTMNNGEDIVPAGQDAQNKITNTGAMYMLTANVQVKDANNNVTWRTDTDWLRWMHEATVVEVAETVDGPTVYTFETALPFDDQRQATIGIFKHAVSDLRYLVTPSTMNGTFCGYVPEGNVPYDKLQDKLNWNHILRRNAFRDDQLAALWNEIAPQAQVAALAVATAAASAPGAAVSFGLSLPDEVMVEAAPMPKQRGYKDWIAGLDWAGKRKKKMKPHRPAVELPRGMRFTVNRAAMIQSGEEAYYPVTECKLEPRAVGLYVRAAEVLESPAESGSRPVRVKENTQLFRVTHGSKDGAAVLNPAGAFLPAGTRLRVSKVHCAGPRDHGDGLIHASDGEEYFLVVECPRRISAHGLLVRRDAVRAIPEKQYEKKALLL